MEIQLCLQSFICRMVGFNPTVRRHSSLALKNYGRGSGATTPQHNAETFMPDIVPCAYFLKRKSWTPAGFFWQWLLTHRPELQLPVYICAR